MTQIVAVVGVSGVGKSTFIRGLRGALSFQHLSAGRIIRYQREREEQAPQAHDELRNLDIDENQRLLVEGFHDLLDASQNLTLFDGHTVIDTSDELRRIEPSVFASLGIMAILFLQEQPETIRSRREADRKRSRPLISPEKISVHQSYALATTAEICLELAIPFLVIDTSQVESAIRFIQAQFTEPPNA